MGDFEKSMQNKDASEATLRMNNGRSFLQSSDDMIRNELSDEILIAQVAQGESKALEILYDRYASTVLGVSLKISGDRVIAEDILQETFWRIWQNAATFQPNRGRFTTWLFRITRNLVIDNYRRNHSQPQSFNNTDDIDPEIDNAPDPDADVAEQTLSFLKHQQVRKALAVLPVAQMQVLEMAYFYGMTRQEIAEATGEALGTINTRARLGLQKLRVELEKQELENENR